MLDLTVVVPVRNAENQVDACLASIVRERPREIIVVDGNSTDLTVALARAYPVRIMSDEGRGLPAARLMGAEAATSSHVALIDSDVVLAEGDLGRLLDEFETGGYTGLQAGLHSVSGKGYWGQALAHHHRQGRSKNWFGVVATVFRRDVLLEHGFNPEFLSGEDIDLRWRLERAGARTGVSKRTVVEHRFGDTWEFAKGQWLADGHGLGRMLAAHGTRSRVLLALPLAAAIRGAGLSLLRAQPRWIPYYACFMAYNYLGMGRELVDRRRRRLVIPAAVG